MVLTVIEISIALGIGIGVGIILQKGRICTNTAFRNLLLIKNGELALILLLTVTVELVGYFILSILPLPGFSFISSPIPFSLLILPLGAFIFGLGTVVAGGCAGGTCYRVGEGSGKSVLAPIGFAIGIIILTIGPLAEFINNIRNSSNWTINNDIPSLEHVLPRWVWTGFAILLAFGGIYWYLSQQRNNKVTLKHLLPRWTPIVSGLLLGMFGIFARYFSTLSGRSFGLSTVDGIFNVFQSITNLELLNWIGVFILGLILGSFISSITGNEFAIQLPAKREVMQYFGGGLIL